MAESSASRDSVRYPLSLTGYVRVFTNKDYIFFDTTVALDLSVPSAQKDLVFFHTRRC